MPERWKAILEFLRERGRPEPVAEITSKLWQLELLPYNARYERGAGSRGVTASMVSLRNRGFVRMLSGGGGHSVAKWEITPKGEEALDVEARR
jgi:hypothetical protein